MRFGCVYVGYHGNHPAYNTMFPDFDEFRPIPPTILSEHSLRAFDLKILFYGTKIMKKKMLFRRTLVTMRFGCVYVGCHDNLRAYNIKLFY